MKRIIFYFSALLFAVWLGVVMRNNPGYVLVSCQDVTIETSLWFAATALIILFMLFYGLLRFGAEVISIFSYLVAWFSNRKKRHARKQTILGLYDLVEGKYTIAEKRLSRAAIHSDMQLINYLAAAFAAQQQHSSIRSNNYLRLAQIVADDRPVVAGLAQVRSLIDNKQLEEAGITLRRLHKSQPRNILILQLMQQVYVELKDWYHLEKLLPILHKVKILDVNELMQLEEKVYSEMLLESVSANRVAKVWNNLPKYLHKNAVLVKIYAGYLLSKNDAKSAEDIIKMVLRKNLDKDLLNIYANMQDIEGVKHLTRAEKWLDGNENNADLLLCLGKICRREKFWGKARDYLEKSAKLFPRAEVYVELAELMKGQNDLQGAMKFYRKASCL